MDPLKPEPKGAKGYLRMPAFWFLAIMTLIFMWALLNRDAPLASAPSPQPTSATTARVSSSSYQPPTIFANMKSWTPTETDCVNLQSWFNGADTMGARARDAGDSEASKWYTDLMIQVDARMESVGCYG